MRRLIRLKPTRDPQNACHIALRQPRHRRQCARPHPLRHARPLTDPASRPAHLIEEATHNLAAPANLTQQPAGAVVNLSSGLALHPKQKGGPHSASKAGLSSFSRYLRCRA
jgi:NAD(P)-dependent dehydrogenase (short-subunit alcohol dehydrogenase family)